VQAGYVCAVSIAEPMSSSAGAGYESSKSVHDTPPTITFTEHHVDSMAVDVAALLDLADLPAGYQPDTSMAAPGVLFGDGPGKCGSEQGLCRAAHQGGGVLAG
jgi:hypothetical protein